MPVQGRWLGCAEVGRLPEPRGAGGWQATAWQTDGDDHAPPLFVSGAVLVALNNDRDQFAIVLEKFAEDAIIDRHQANGMLFNAFFEKPGFREALLDYLGTAYDEINAEGAS